MFNTTSVFGMNKIHIQERERERERETERDREREGFLTDILLQASN